MHGCLVLIRSRDWSRTTILSTVHRDQVEAEFENEIRIKWSRERVALRPPGMAGFGHDVNIVIIALSVALAIFLESFVSGAGHEAGRDFWRSSSKLVGSLWRRTAGSTYNAGGTVVLVFPHTAKWYAIELVIPYRGNRMSLLEQVSVDRLESEIVDLIKSDILTSDDRRFIENRVMSNAADIVDDDALTDGNPQIELIVLRHEGNNWKRRTMSLKEWL